MKVDGRSYRTIWAADDGSVEVIDQTKLPHVFEVQAWRSMQDAADGIRTMVVRGAPLIGVAGAYGLALALRDDASDTGLAQAYDTLLATRPTAVNLAWALNAARAEVQPLPPSSRAESAWRLAAKLADEDVACCRAIGEHGARLIGRRLCCQRQKPACQCTDPLQCRLAGNGRLGHGTRPCLCRAW